MVLTSYYIFLVRKKYWALLEDALAILGISISQGVFRWRVFFSKFWWLLWFPAQIDTCLKICNTVYIFIQFHEKSHHQTQLLLLSAIRNKSKFWGWKTTLDDTKWRVPKYVRWFYAKNLLKDAFHECASIKTRLWKYDQLNTASYLKMDLMNAMRFNKNKAMEIWPAKHSASGAKNNCT